MGSGWLEMGKAMRLNVGCGEHYAEGWINSDEAQRGDTPPDVLVVAGKPHPFADECMEAIYCGHVLEHMNFLTTAGPFMQDMYRMLKPGGSIMVTGPDFIKAIDAYKAGSIPKFLMLSIAEHVDFGSAPAGGAQHYWNCTADRMLQLLEFGGFEYSERLTIPDTERWHGERGIMWPTTNYTDLWQSAFIATKPL